MVSPLSCAQRRTHKKGFPRLKKLTPKPSGQAAPTETLRERSSPAHREVALGVSPSRRVPVHRRCSRRVGGSRGGVSPPGRQGVKINSALLGASFAPLQTLRLVGASFAPLQTLRLSISLSLDSDLLVIMECVPFHLWSRFYIFCSYQLAYCDLLVASQFLTILVWGNL